MSEINLSAATLEPFKTKVITRNGSRMVFTGYDGLSYPYNFTLVHKVCEDAHYPNWSNYALKENGRISVGSQHALDIVKIIPTWVPQPGDIVYVRGLLVRSSNDNHLRGQEESVVEWTVIREYGDPGYFVVNTSGRSGEWICFKSNMRLVRRPPRS